VAEGGSDAFIAGLQRRKNLQVLGLGNGAQGRPPDCGHAQNGVLGTVSNRLEQQRAIGLEAPLADDAHGGDAGGKVVPGIRRGETVRARTCVPPPEMTPVTRNNSDFTLLAVIPVLNARAFRVRLFPTFTLPSPGTGMLFASGSVPSIVWRMFAPEVAHVTVTLNDRALSAASGANMGVATCACCADAITTDRKIPRTVSRVLIGSGTEVAGCAFIW